MHTIIIDNCHPLNKRVEDMPYHERRERRHERRGNDSKERPEDKSKIESKTDEGKKDTRETRKDSDRTRTTKHSKAIRNRSRSRDNDSEQEDSRAERTDRFKSERFAEDRSALTSSRRNDREFRSNRVGRSAATRDGRRQGSYRERRYDRRAEDYDMSKVTEKLTNPTYVPKDGRYFLHDDREMTGTRRRNMQRSRSPLKWEHDLFQDHESKEQEEIAVNDIEDDNMKWRSVVQVPMGSTGFGPQYDNFYHQYQRQQDGRWMHDKYFEMERAATAAAATR